jgi:hypothetical protein
MIKVINLEIINGLERIFNIYILKELKTPTQRYKKKKKLGLQWRHQMCGIFIHKIRLEIPHDFSPWPLPC